MDKTGMELVGRFLSCRERDQQLQMWTIIQVLSNTEDSLAWRELRREEWLGEGKLDAVVLEQVLNHASNHELLTVLSKNANVLRGIPVTLYRRFFDKLCADGVADEDLCALGHSARMFYRYHGSSLVFPRDLLARLLSSHDLERRIRGLTLLSQSDLPPRDRIKYILDGIDVGSPTDFVGFDLLCLTPFREFMWEHDLASIGDGCVAHCRRTLYACLSRQDDPEDRAIVHQCLAYLPQEGP